MSIDINSFEHHIHIHTRKADCAFITIKGAENNILRAKLLRAGYLLSIIEAQQGEQPLTIYMVIDHLKRGELKTTATEFAQALNASLVFAVAGGDFSVITPQSQRCLGVLNYGREAHQAVSSCGKDFSSDHLLAVITQANQAELVHCGSAFQLNQLSRAEVYGAAMFARLAVTDNPAEARKLTALSY